MRIDPATGQRIGAPEQIPGARPIVALEEPVALAARPAGGGVWIAYAAGDRIRLARLGTGQAVDAATVASA